MPNADFIPEGAVVLSKIEIIEYLDAKTGEYLIAERYWTGSFPKAQWSCPRSRSSNTSTPRPANT
jgi:hypothetical protein